MMAGRRLAAALTACVLVATAARGLPPPAGPAPAAPTERAACDAAGGTWGKFGMLPAERCNLPTRDGGRACRRQADCEGACIADVTDAERDALGRGGPPIEREGKCAEWRLVFGCLPLVEDGRVETVVCID
jgi:hypothetical protein